MIIEMNKILLVLTYCCQGECLILLLLNLTLLLDFT